MLVKKVNFRNMLVEGSSGTALTLAALAVTIAGSEGT